AGKPVLGPPEGAGEPAYRGQEPDLSRAGAALSSRQSRAFPRRPSRGDAQSFRKGPVMMDSLVSATELAGRLGEPGLVILDCSVAVARGGGEARAVAMDEAFAESHIAGALYVDVARALSDPASPLRFTRPRSEALGRVLAGLGIGSDSEVVLYSKERYWTATRAFWVLANAGHRRVRVLDGGWRHWTVLGLPVETGAARLPEAVPVERWGDAGLFCDMDAVRTALETG